MSTMMEQIEWNTRYSAMTAERTAMNTAIMTSQLSELLETNFEQLAVQKMQLNVQNEIRDLGQQQLVVQKHQLAQAMKIVQSLDLTNHRLAQIDASLADITGVLVQQNALIQKSLTPLATEAQELIERGMEAFGNEWYKDAAKDFEAALSKNPYSAIAYYFLGKCYHHEGRSLDASQTYQKCIFYARKSAPIFNCLALCDLAFHALKGKKTTEARQFIDKALACSEQDKVVLVSTLLQCDLAEGSLRPKTCDYILTAFSDESVDPEVLLEVASIRVAKVDNDSLKHRVDEEKKNWQQATQNALFQRLMSHFYRELDDFVYLAPRIRRGFMEAAGGKFLSLGDPLADLLDWTVMIGEQILKRIDTFPSNYPDILRFYRPLREWNAMLVRLNRLIGVLAPKSDLVEGQFVERQNLLGLVELPRMYEDDNILFEVNTEEGDTLALSCYYAIFSRNGQDHYPVSLSDYPILKIDTLATSPITKAVLVVDPRHGQTLIQGTTGFFTWKGKDEKHYLIDSFVEVASLLAELHECIQWAIKHEGELFSVCLLLHAVVEKTSGNHRALPSSVADDGFEVVEDAPPDIWYIARNNKQLGPFTWNRLQDLAAKGKLHPTDMLLQEGGQKWKSADSVPGLNLDN